ncbi:uncharacterized protein TrAFT101_000059 [Trichoderma asperellum]|uniref:uncharacterized protein n=1 Tax=Trichoderma asperellum TaxID=101201 RepID=UPI003316E808|nr:hypothetical protein TrAFT101_000059 [Trichoderma asperellum]
MTRRSRVLHFTAHSFDAILLEILITLMVGACICIPSDEQRMNDLKGAINNPRVNWAGMTPTLAKLLSPVDVPLLESLTVWGEAPDLEIINTWADKVVLFNAWGPAEQAHAVQSFMGRFVLQDNYKQLAPIGAIGEVIIQGPSVARCYLYDEARTAGAFIEPASWTNSPPDAKLHRAYRTGDLVRYADDGSLELVGRRDTQVKLRRQRIEMSEIEYHLNLYSPGGAIAAVESVRSANRPLRQILTAFFWPLTRIFKKGSGTWKRHNSFSLRRIFDLQKQHYPSNSSASD